MNKMVAVRLGAATLAAVWLLLQAGRRLRAPWLMDAVLLLWSLAAIGWLTIVVSQHVVFPLHLDLMEGSVLQQTAEAAAGRPMYPIPTPDYAPLAYAPLYYFMAAPLFWFTGPSLPVLRLVAIAGLALSIGLIGTAVWQRTGSRWWAVIAAGLFAASYRAMDSYLDTAHSDSWMLATALLGTWLLERAHGPTRKTVAVLVLVASFWFKQHGAFFALGGVTYLVTRDGFRQALPYAVLAALAGPGLYLLADPWPMGEAFHYLTYTVPSAWSTPEPRAFLRFVRYVATWYPALGLAAIVGTWRLCCRWQPPDAWRTQLFAALATACLGVMDYGSANNVFIPLGAWLILAGSLELATAGADHTSRWLPDVRRFAVAVSFAALLYDPREVLVSSRAGTAYADLVAMIRALPGTVYAPFLAWSPDLPNLYPRAHWVAIDDMVRGRGGRILSNRDLAETLVGPARHPRGEAWILTNGPLSRAGRVVRDLAACYVLAEDFGNRFEPLAGTPRRFDHGWPRYLYRHQPTGLCRDS